MITVSIVLSLAPQHLPTPHSVVLVMLVNKLITNLTTTDVLLDLQVTTRRQLATCLVTPPMRQSGMTKVPMKKFAIKQKHVLCKQTLRLYNCALKIPLPLVQ